LNVMNCRHGRFCDLGVVSVQMRNVREREVSSTSEPSVFDLYNSSSSVIFVSHNVEEWISASSGEIPAGEVTGDGGK